MDDAGKSVTPVVTAAADTIAAPAGVKSAPATTSFYLDPHTDKYD